MKTFKKAIAILAIIATVISCLTISASATTTNEILSRLSTIDKQGYIWKDYGNLKPGSSFKNGECWQYVLGLSTYVMNKKVSIPSTTCYFSGSTRDYYRVKSSLKNCNYNQIVNLLKESQPGDIVGLKNSKTNQTYGHIIFIGNNSNGKLTVYQAYSGQARKQTVDLTVNGLKNLGSFGYGGKANFNSESYGVCLFRHKDMAAATKTDNTQIEFKTDGLTVPGNVKLGTSFGLRGEITCNKIITNITAGLYTDANGKNAKQTVSVNPNSTTYNLNGKVNNSLIFGKLSKGTYYYRITATAAGKTTVIVNSQFRIVPSITISGATVPSSVKKGNSFGLRGTISDTRNITNVTAGIYTDANGKNAKQTVSVNPNSASYNLNGKVNNSLIFGKLAKGTYYYIVTASDSYGTEKLISQKFTVV